MTFINDLCKHFPRKYCNVSFDGASNVERFHFVQKPMIAPALAYWYRLQSNLHGIERGEGGRTNFVLI